MKQSELEFFCTNCTAQILGSMFTKFRVAPVHIRKVNIKFSLNDLDYEVTSIAS
jgi:hypothetical protein